MYKINNKLSKEAKVSYAQNAQYGEMSQQQSTKAKIDAQGGTDAAVNVDTKEATIKAKTQAEVVDAQLKQAGAKDGLDASIKDLANATDKLAQTAGTLAAGKTASDIELVKNAGGSNQYIEGQAQIGVKEGSKLAKSMEVAGSQIAKNNILNTAFKGADDLGHGKEFIAEAEDLGFGKFDPRTNSFTATRDARQWVAATGAASANNATMEDSWTIGGVAFSQKLDSHGKGTVTASSGTEERILSTDAKTRNTQDSAKANGHTAEEVQDEINETRSNLDVFGKLEAGAGSMVVTSKKEGLVESEDNDGTTSGSFLAHNSENIAMGLGGLGLGTSVLYGVNEKAKMLQPEKIPMTENDIKAKGFTVDTDGVISNKSGSVITEKDGKYFDVNNEPMTKPNPKHKTGPVKRAFDASIQKADDLKSNLSSPFTRSDKTIDKATQHQQSENNSGGSNGPDNEIKHGKPLDKDNNIITQNKKTSSKGDIKGNTKATIMDSLEAKSAENAKSVKSGTMSKADWTTQELALDTAKNDVSGNNIRFKQLKDLGIDTKDMSLERGENHQLF